MDTNSTNEIEIESEESLISKKIQKAESASSLSTAQSFEDDSSEELSPIKEVFASNFNEEIKIIRSIIDEGIYTYIGMDTEFPGNVENLKILNNDFYYQNMKLNVESTNLIQLGITLSDRNGNFPTNIPYHTWQFNLKFDIDNDKYSEKSIKLLKNSGFNFENLKNNGINYKKFSKGLMNSGLVLNPKTKWISYHGLYDFAYLLKALRNEAFPNNENDFIKTLQLYFPNFYDIKMLIKDNNDYFHGGLNRLIFLLEIERQGIKHQAGSDAIATVEAFHKLIKKEDISKNTLKKFKNVLYGIGLGQDNNNTIKYLNNYNNLNINNINSNAIFYRNMMMMYLKQNNCNSKTNQAKCFYQYYQLNNIMRNNILMYQMKMAQESKEKNLNNN